MESAVVQGFLTNLAKERWVDNQKSNLLNVGYFHVVFTIPDTLDSIVFQKSHREIPIQTKKN